MLFLFTLLAFSSAVVHYSPKYHSQGFHVSPVNSGDSLVSFTFSVREQNMQKIRDIVVQVSDPDSPQYGNYLSSAEIEELTRPAMEDVSAVTTWLTLAGVPFTVVNHRDVQVTITVDEASTLLSTNFVSLELNNHKLIRAADYSLPQAVHEAVGAVFGLHGLPLPIQTALPNQPANVTPAVLASTYQISGVTPAGSTTNRMAVAEFQGQYMKDSDLVQFFKNYVPNAQPGDDAVYKFVGSADRQQAGVEASLDIQYIMGVAPHLKAEFWLFAGQDFCQDLKNWTSTILADDGAPLVHSVSYGWQGNLTQVGCTGDIVGVIDDNYAKLATKGITIIFASGDSGSGYAPSQAHCDSSDFHKDTQLTGTVSEKLSHFPNFEECCDIASQRGAAGFQFDATPPSPGLTCEPGSTGKADTAYTGNPARKLELHVAPTDKGRLCCELARQSGPYFSVEPGTAKDTVICSLFDGDTEPPTKSSPGAYSGKAAEEASGACSLYSSVSGTSAKPGSVSGKPTTPSPSKVQLWPSWPASSPYITAVGATRFVGQQVGNAEMATDQFGSGGGFSQQFDQTNAQWQVAAVKHYTDNPPNDPHYPPAGSFPVTGRATPDVSALGEGYQVVADGRVEAVGGTSASAPAFAGMVALLNEARIQKSKPAMGFLNPFLYKNADAFRDVTLGTNAIGRGTGPIKYGFNATAGWDPATGLGTPIFPKLLAAALNA